MKGEYGLSRAGVVGMRGGHGLSKAGLTTGANTRYSVRSTREPGRPKGCRVHDALPEGVDQDCWAMIQIAAPAII
eukprot:546952-Alexandrium_andersonii.AAC.1